MKRFEHQNRPAANSLSKASDLDPIRQQTRLADDARDLFFSPPAALVITVVLLLLSTWGTRWLEILTDDPRPFTLLFLVPVAFGSAFFGVTGGLLTALASVIIARVFLFPASLHPFLLSNISDDVEMTALIFGTGSVAIVTGRLREVLGKLRKANNDLEDSEQLRQSFSREVLLAVTGGVLHLCTEEEINTRLFGVPDIALTLRVPADATKLRHTIVREAKQRAVILNRLSDLRTAATEAATNAVKHGKGGQASVWFGKDKVSVLIKDNGSGISPAELARATLERGFSTRVSLGMGYYMMIESVDAMSLCTSSHGTTILLTVGELQKSTIEQNIMERYSSI